MQEKREDTIWIALGNEIPGVDAAAAFAIRPDCGAVNIFTGITRNHEKGKQVQTLYYDCYEKMALAELYKIAALKCRQYQAGKVVVFHRTGEVPIGSCSLVVAVSAPHRKEALDATRDIIDTLKREVPIWKKETFQDKTLWKEEQ